MTERLAEIALLSASSCSQASRTDKERGRNWWTRTLDATIAAARIYVPPLHWLGAAAFAVCLFIYAHLCALTIRLTATGAVRWPEVPHPSVLAVWHGEINALLVALVRQRPRATVAIMVAGNPRGDSLAMLCRLLRLHVARIGSDDRGWEALAEIADEIKCGACVVMAADGRGPARLARVGTIALASATAAPVLTLGVACSPAIKMPHKWDEARTPLPFGRLVVTVNEARYFPPLNDSTSIEEARLWLQHSLDEVAELAGSVLAERLSSS